MKVYTGKPSIPNLGRFNYYVKKAKRHNWLSNNGKLLQLFKKKIQKKLKIKNFVFVTSGTTGIQLALKVLNVKKKVITTPFTFVATANAAKWLNLDIKFCDISKHNLNLNSNHKDLNHLKKNDAIIPVHSFGIPADIEKFEKLRKKTKVIYDAAHCFGIQYKGKSILNFGDASVVSLHATKVFNTCEGGIVVFKKTRDYKLAEKLSNLGSEGKEYSKGDGINMKMNEIQAAWGLSLLEKFEKIKKRRKNIFHYYLKHLNKSLWIPTKNLNSNNFCYFPIILNNEKALHKIISKLKKKKIFLKRYFYPSLNTLPHLKTNGHRNSIEISKKIICLPIHEELKKKTLDSIIKVINSFY